MVFSCLFFFLFSFFFFSLRLVWTSSRSLFSSCFVGSPVWQGICSRCGSFLVNWMSWEKNWPMTMTLWKPKNPRCRREQILFWKTYSRGLTFRTHFHSLSCSHVILLFNFMTLLSNCFLKFLCGGDPALHASGKRTPGAAHKRPVLRQDQVSVPLQAITTLLCSYFNYILVQVWLNLLTYFSVHSDQCLHVLC